MANRIHADLGSAPGRPDHIARRGASPAPVADEQPLAHQNYIVGSHADLERTQDLAADYLNFMHAIGKIRTDVEALAVWRQGQSAGDLRLAPGGVGWRQRNSARRNDASVRRDVKDSNGTGDVAEENVLAVRREEQSREADLPVVVCAVRR